MDQALGHRLGTDVHQPPLVQLVVAQFQFAAVQCGQDILCPRHQQPYDRALFAADRLQDRLGPGALQDDGLTAGDQTAEPVHLRAGMIQRRNAQEAVVLGLTVMGLLHPCGMDQAPVLMEDRFRKTRRTGGEIDRRVVFFRQFAGREAAAALADQLRQVVRETGTAGAGEHQGDMRDLVRDFFHTADEFRPEDHHIALAQVQAVFDLVGGIAEVHRNRQRAGLQDAEIDRQPIDAVHQQDGNLLALADAVAPEHVGHAVRLFIENRPGNFPAVVFLFYAGLNQFKIVPGNPSGFRLVRVDFHQCGVVRPLPGISLQQFNNGHNAFTFLFCHRSFFITSRCDVILSGAAGTVEGSHNIILNSEL